MSKPIGMTGVARMVSDKGLALTFKANGSVTKTQALDPKKTYAVFASGAGPANLSIAASNDDLNSVGNGTAKFAAAKVYTALAAAGGYIGTVGPGASALKVTHAKNGAGTDDAPTVALLGGRYQVRIVEDGDASTGLGDYTAVTAD